MTASDQLPPGNEWEPNPDPGHKQDNGIKHWLSGIRDNIEAETIRVFVYLLILVLGGGCMQRMVWRFEQPQPIEHTQPPPSATTPPPTGTPQPTETATAAPTATVTETQTSTTTPSAEPSVTPQAKCVGVAPPVGVPPVGPDIYIVQYGDELENIAAAFGVTVDAIVEANREFLPSLLDLGGIGADGKPWSGKDCIVEGWPIRIPGLAPVPAATPTMSGAGLPGGGAGVVLAAHTLPRQQLTGFTPASSLICLIVLMLPVLALLVRVLRRRRA